MPCEDGAVVGDQGDALGLGKLRDRHASRAIERVHDQDLGAQVDVGGGIVQLGRVASLRVVDPVLRLGVPGVGKGSLQVRLVEVNLPRRRRGVGQDHPHLQAGGSLGRELGQRLELGHRRPDVNGEGADAHPAGIVVEPLATRCRRRATSYDDDPQPQLPGQRPPPDRPPSPARRKRRNVPWPCERKRRLSLTSVTQSHPIPLSPDAFRISRRGHRIVLGSLQAHA